jgi:hypothetical protein
MCKEGERTKPAPAQRGVPAGRTPVLCVAVGYCLPFSLIVTFAVKAAIFASPG